MPRLDPVRKANVARVITPVDRFCIRAVHGLVQPAGGDMVPFLWSKTNGYVPIWIRFVWNPQTGTAILGTNPDCFHHSDLIPASRRYPFGAWVRGFYLPEMKWVGIRPFFWPRRVTDPWNSSHARLNTRISRQVARRVGELLPKARIEMDIDNRRLQELTGLRGW